MSTPRTPAHSPAPRQSDAQHQMDSQPQSAKSEYRGSGKLQDKVALITGGDSGIGRAVAILYAREGARVAVVYLKEDRDAQETQRLVQQESGGQCLLLRGDIGDEAFCQQALQQTVQAYGQLDILVNNAAEQHPQESIDQITTDQLERTFRTNIFSQFFLVKAALPHLKPGSVIINTASVTAYRGSPTLLDYSATKGAIVAFTRSLSESLVKQGIRVNGVAPGPIWTPLITSTFPQEKIASFGKDTPMERPGQPEEVAPAYVFLAASDSSYMTGQILHINGGEVVNG